MVRKTDDDWAALRFEIRQVFTPSTAGYPCVRGTSMPLNFKRRHYRAPGLLDKATPPTYPSTFAIGG